MNTTAECCGYQEKATSSAPPYICPYPWLCMRQLRQSVVTTTADSLYFFGRRVSMPWRQGYNFYNTTALKQFYNTTATQPHSHTATATTVTTAIPQYRNTDKKQCSVSIGKKQ